MGEDLSDLLAYSEELVPLSGQGKPSKISPDGLVLDASSGTRVCRDGLPVTKAVAEKDFSNILAILDALGGISAGTDDMPVTNAEVVLSRNGSSLLQVGDADRLLGSDQLPVTEKEQTDKMLKTDENHRFTRKLEAENFVQEKVAEEKVSGLSACSDALFPVSGQRKPSKKISAKGTICCFGWFCHRQR